MFKKIWGLWKKFGHFITTIVGFIITTFLYLVVITPIGILIRVSTDYFHIKNSKKSNWIQRSEKDLTLEDMRRQ